MAAKGENQLFAIVLAQSKIDRLLNAGLGKLLIKNHLSLSEWLVLGIVKQAKREGLSMTAVATAADMSQSQITTLSSNLLRHHLVRQKTQSLDKRSRHLIITDKGSRLLARVNSALANLSNELDKVMESKHQQYINLSDEFAHVLRELNSQKDE